MRSNLDRLQVEPLRDGLRQVVLAQRDEAHAHHWTAREPPLAIHHAHFELPSGQIGRTNGVLERLVENRIHAVLDNLQMKRTLTINTALSCSGKNELPQFCACRSLCGQEAGKVSRTDQAGQDYQHRVID